MNNQARICNLKCKYNIQNICHVYGNCIAQPIGHCKDCDKWKQGKTGNDEDWYSNEGFCSNWRAITGEDFYCGDFEVKENNK